ncbi:MAG: hypothetical protein AAGK14_00815 [Verrucomicrobiota bacterium]
MLTRRIMLCGFNATKDQDGRTEGAAVIRLARRNAYEMVGLRRPHYNPMAAPRAT